MPELTTAQKAIKAQTKIDNLELEEDLSNLNTKLDELFNDAPIQVSETISKAELEQLITEIRNGTATNTKITRFLDLANKLNI